MSDRLSAPHTRAGRIQRACLELLREHKRNDAVPTNGRFVYYELEQQGAIPKHYLDGQGRKRARQPEQDRRCGGAALRISRLPEPATWQPRSRFIKCDPVACLAPLRALDLCVPVGGFNER
jgi:hypothetical protein